MSYRVEASFAPAHELILSMYMYLCKKAHRRLELGAAWPKETRMRLTTGFAEQLEELGEMKEWAHLHLLAWRCPEQETVEGFLTWFAGLGVGEIYEQLSPYVQYFPMDLGEMRDRAVSALTEWNAQYFQQMDAHVVELLREDADEKQRARTEMDAQALTEWATNGLRFEEADELEKVLLIPQYHAQPSAYLHHFKGLIVCQYPTMKLPLGEPDDPSPALFRMTKSLADKTRLKILRFLREEPRTFVEVVSHLGMSKSTVYEHLLNLRAAGLIRGHVRGESVSLYELRKSAFDQLHGLLHEHVE